MMAKRILLAGLLLVLNLSVSAQEAKRVVSLAPSLTSILYEVGANDRLVGCTSYCTQALADGVAQVGSTVDINIEKLLSLHPDLVLAMQLTKPQDIAAMKKLGIRVELISTPRNFEEICAQTIHVGRLVGKGGQAGELISRVRERVDAISRKAGQLKPQKVFFQIGANPIFTVLENTYMNDFITLCKGENIAAGLARGTMTREGVMFRQPDVIIIATMGGFGEQELEAWKDFKGIPAVDKQRIFLIDSETSCSPSPLAFVSALEDVYRFMSE